MSGATDRPAVSAVVPVYNGRSYLERCLPALFALDGAEALEVIVVDDGSDDGSAEYAAGLGARVVPSGGCRLGPASARNVGVREARGEVLLFVDADVVVHRDVLARVREAFTEPDVVAIFGSYDEQPPHRGFSSQYMNLRHHFVHQEPADDAQTFWSGLGAVRRRAFLDVGGFDPERFPRPSIEDIELGRRLRDAGGRIRRIPTLQATHLKEWSLLEVVRTDVFARALPWARLMQQHPGAFTDLNVGLAERLKSLLAGVFWLALGLGLLGLVPLWWAALLLVGAAFANRALLAVFHARNGPWFALRALVYHQLYYVYSAAVFVYTAIEHRLGGAPVPAAPGRDAGARSD